MFPHHQITKNNGHEKSIHHTAGSIHRLGGSLGAIPVKRGRSHERRSALRCTGYGKKAAIAATDAELSAIKTLLFAGAQGTPYSIPLIQESKEATEEKYKSFFDDFYNNTYKNFIESSVIVAPYGKNALKQKCITLDVCIRVAQLRAYLESNDIIRKFGL